MTQLQNAKNLVKKELDAVTELIAAQLGSDINIIKSLGEHIFSSGGKRIRPTLVLLSAKLFGYCLDKHIILAAIVELIHTATLLHDDVVDRSLLRRGKVTANVIWGSEASILVGDFIYSKSFQLMTEMGNLKVLKVLADTSNTIAAGEVMQLTNRNNSKISIAHYMQVIERKTATLFAAASKLGAIITEQDEITQTKMADYGMQLGIAFQLIDDALDYGASNKDIGKNIGDDLAEGKATLPLLHALNIGTPTQKHLITTAICEGVNIEKEPQIVANIQEVIHATNAIDFTFTQAKKHAELAITALDSLPQNTYTENLIALAEFAVAREF